MTGLIETTITDLDIWALAWEPCCVCDRPLFEGPFEMISDRVTYRLSGRIVRRYRQDYFAHAMCLDEDSIEDCWGI